MFYKTPLAVAVSLAMATVPGAGFAATAGSEEYFWDYGYVPNYQYIEFSEEEDGYFGKYLTVDADQDPLSDPLFLSVGQAIEDFPYALQNPEEINAVDRDAVNIRMGSWSSAIVVNTGTISAQGTVAMPFEEDEGLDEETELGELNHSAVGILIDDGAKVTGLAATAENAALLGDEPVFAAGDERVAIYNAGSLVTDGHAIVMQGEYDEYENAEENLEERVIVNGSIINRTSVDGSGGAISSTQGHAILIDSADLKGRIVNGGGHADFTESMLSRDDTIALVNGAGMYGDIVNYDTLLSEDGSVINIQDSHFEGSIVNHAKAAMTALDGAPTIQVSNTSGSVFIDQRGLLRSMTQSGQRGVAMDLSGSNVLARVAGGTVDGDIRLKGATLAFAGGDLQGNVSNQGGVVLIEGHQTLLGGYEQDAQGTLQFSNSNDQVSSLKAERVTLADGSTLVFGNGEAYRKGKDLVTIEADELNLNLDALNLETASGLYRVRTVELSADGTQLLVTYAGIDGREVASVAIERTGATGTRAKQLRGLGNALNRVLANGSDKAVEALINAIGNDAAIEELLPDTSGASVEGTTAAVRSAGNAISMRARGMAAGDTFAGQGVWLKGLYAELDQDERDGISGYNSDTQGFVLGSDVALHNGLTLGLAWAHTNTDVTGKNGLTSSEIEFDQWSVYGGFAHGQWIFDAQASYGQGSNEAARHVLGSRAKASFDSNQVGVQVGAGYEWMLNEATRVTPRLSLDYSRLDMDAYSETGAGALNLAIDGQRYEQFELGLDTELAYLTQVKGWMVEPRFTMGVFHDFEAEAQNNLAAFAMAPEETFVVGGADVDKTRYTAGVGVDIYNEGGFTTSLDYSHGWKDDMTSDAGALKVRYDF